ncbi:hypothetical protein JST97_08885 [bacterium]|nr:hypothetical protein [bacterium]
MVNWRLLGMCCLSALLLGGFYWQRRQWNQERKEQYGRLAWMLRRGDDESRLSPARRAYLEGRFVECLRLLEQSDSGGDRELQTAAFQGLLFQLPWPEQVLRSEQVEASKQRPRLLARAVQTGYAEDAEKTRVDLNVWENERLQKLTPSSKQTLTREQDWKSVDEMVVVHLDRKDERLSQLLISGRTREGQQRLDVLYGKTEWKRWSLFDSRKIKHLDDRVAVEKGPIYKLIEDDWVKVQP